MARQRNNVARMVLEHRQLVCRMLLNGSTYAGIRAALEDAGAKLTAHDRSLKAYSESGEYRQYCDMARGWNQRLEKRRWAASLMRDGAGPQSLADLAEMEILEQLHDVAAGGVLETGKDIATVARAITSLQRTQLARRQEESDARVQALEAEHAAEIAEKNAEIARIRAQVARLTEEQTRQGEIVDPERRTEVIEAMNDFVRGPQ